MRKSHVSNLYATMKVVLVIYHLSSAYVLRVYVIYDLATLIYKFYTLQTV